MKRIPYIVALFFILMGIGSSGFMAQSVKVVVAHKKIKMGEQFEYKLVINGEASSYTTPDLKDFIIHSGPNKSLSMTWKQGVQTVSMSYYWTLEPKHTGKSRIGSSSVKFANKTCKSKSIRIKVTQPQKTVAVHNSKSQQKTMVLTHFMFIA